MQENVSKIMHWQIGDWDVDAERNSMSRETHEVTLSPRLADLIVYMAAHAGHVVSRDELVTHVWHRAIVTDQAVNQSIFELRKALRDGRSKNDAPIYINTVSKRGYVLVAEARALGEETVQSGNIPQEKSFHDHRDQGDGSCLAKHLWSPMVAWIDELWHPNKSDEHKL